MSFPPIRTDYIIKQSDQNNDYINKIIDEAIKSYSSQVIIYKNNTKILDIRNKNSDDLIETYSITKSFCAIAVMFLIQDKLIKDENDLVCKYIKSWNYGKKKDIKIKHILTHTSGLDTYWNYDEYMGTDVTSLSLAINKTHNHNTKWYYNNTASQVIPTLIKIITKMNISKYLKLKLFGPLNIKFKWNRDNKGNDYGANGLSISVNSLCKVGLLIANNGIWENKRILNVELINKMTRKRINQTQMKPCPLFNKKTFTGYGYLWYKYNDMLIAYGFLGQQLIIDKKRNMVVSRIVQPHWDNKKFIAETKKTNIRFNKLKDHIKLI